MVKQRKRKLGFNVVWNTYLIGDSQFFNGGFRVYKEIQLPSFMVAKTGNWTNPIFSIYDTHPKWKSHNLFEII